MLDHLSATDHEIRSYFAKPAGLGFAGKLLKEKRRKSLAELLGYAAAIESCLATTGRSSGFSGYFEEFKALRASIAFQVWASPAAYHWNAMARMLLDAKLHSIIPAGILREYLEFLNLDLEQGLNAHLNDFGRFILSARILSRREARLDVPVSIRLPSALPGTGIALFAHQNERRTISVSCLDQSTVDHLVAARDYSEGRGTVVFESADGYEVTAGKMPRWKGLNGDILIDAFEPCLNLPYIEGFPRGQARDQSVRFLKVIESGLDRLAKYNPALVDEIGLLTASITPMDTTMVDAEMCSGTSSAIFGGCFLALTNEPLYLAEMLLHEFCHNKLRLFEEVFPLLRPESINNVQYYSPWRDEPRPLEGIQHGLFVFGSIAFFWLSIWNDIGATQRERTLAQRRVATLLHQLKYASAEFCRHAHVTDYGRVFVDEIGDWIVHLEEEIAGWDLRQVLPFFSGVLADRSLKMIPLVEALFQHRSNWERLYRAGGYGQIG